MRYHYLLLTEKQMPPEKCINKDTSQHWYKDLISFPAPATILLEIALTNKR